MKTFTIAAPAKINLLLEILGKRQDGYHELRTVMHTLALHDMLTLSEHKKGLKIVCAHPLVPVDERNLVYQAAFQLGKRMGIEPRVKIQIRKRIPVAAGLGGGSSDAAATLLGLSHFWRLNNPSVLLSIAKKLGSDVPFFLTQGCALGLGRGERIKSLPAYPDIPVVVVNPGISVSTAEVYKKFSLRLTRKKACINMMRLALKEKNIIKISQYLFNHLESVTERLHPKIAQIKADLLNFGALGALMAGSGSTVFGIAPTHRMAREIAGKMKKKFPTVIATRTSSPF